MIDPPGFALENYDVMGGWRDHYRALKQGLPSPAPELTGGKRCGVAHRPCSRCFGRMTDGSTFRGLDDYKRLLLQDKAIFARALSEK